MTPTHMDYVRDAILTILVEGGNEQDLWLVAEHAETPERLSEAANIWAQTVPSETCPIIAFVVK